MEQFLKNSWFKILAAIILLIGLGGHPYDYYQYERWAILIIGGYSAHLAYKNKAEAWVWIFAVIAVLFNPIAPFYMARGTWQIFDVVAAVLFLVSTFAKFLSEHLSGLTEFLEEHEKINMIVVFTIIGSLVFAIIGNDIFNIEWATYPFAFIVSFLLGWAILKILSDSGNNVNNKLPHKPSPESFFD